MVVYSDVSYKFQGRKRSNEFLHRFLFKNPMETRYLSQCWPGALRRDVTKSKFKSGNKCACMSQMPVPGT